MRRSASRRDLHPLAAFALVLTGLAALVGGLLLVGIGIAEWLNPLVLSQPTFLQEPRPLHLLPLTLIPCLVGASGLLMPGTRFVGGGGRIALLGVFGGAAMLGADYHWPGAHRWFISPAFGALLLPIGLALFGRWVTLSGRYPELGSVPRLLGIAPTALALWLLALVVADDFNRYRYWDEQYRLFATQFIAAGMNWLVIWWISWFGRPACPTPACPVQAREVAPQPASQVIRTAMRQVLRRYGPAANDSSASIRHSRAISDMGGSASGWKNSARAISSLSRSGASSSRRQSNRIVNSPYPPPRVARARPTSTRTPSSSRTSRLAAC